MRRVLWLLLLLSACSPTKAPPESDVEAQPALAEKPAVDKPDALAEKSPDNGSPDGASPSTAAPEPLPPVVDPAKACEAGEAQACFELALSLERGGAEPTAVAELRAKACEGGVSLACCALAEMLCEGSLPEDGPRAVTLYAKCCEGGISQGCDGLGDLYELGTCVEKDYAEAEKWTLKACELGAPQACVDLGDGEMPRYHHETDGDFYDWKPDPSQLAKATVFYDKALEAFARSCRAGDLETCRELSRMYRQGENWGLVSEGVCEDEPECGGEDYRQFYVIERDPPKAEEFGALAVPQ